MERIAVICKHKKYMYQDYPESKFPDSVYCAVTKKDDCRWGYFTECTSAWPFFSEMTELEDEVERRMRPY